MRKGIRLAFAGASGTGKTTLAGYFAALKKLEMVPVTARRVAQEMGLTCPYDADEWSAGRKEFSRALITKKSAWEHSRESFVTDRTVADEFAYALLHDVRATCDMWQTVASSMRQYTHIVYCPLSVFCDIGNDPMRCRDANYHMAYDAMLFGLLYRAGAAFLTLTQSEPERRVEAVTRFLAVR